MNKKKNTILTSLILIGAITLIVVILYSTFNTSYYSKTMNDKINVPVGSYFICEKDYEESCEVSFIMFGREEKIVEKLRELNFNINENNMFQLDDWIETNRGLYKQVTLVYCIK